MFNHHCMAGYPVGFYYQNRFPMPAYIVYCIVHINMYAMASKIPDMIFTVFIRYLFD